MEDELVASGRFVRIETRGRASGLDRPVTVGFVDDDGTPGRDPRRGDRTRRRLGRNLLADATCHVRVGDRSFDAVAEPLAGAEHALAIRGLILRYGTPAEGLGRGPSFRLRPVGEGASVTVSVDIETVIDRPAADVFAALIDVERYPEWLIAPASSASSASTPGHWPRVRASASARRWPAARPSSTAA
jgi:hypothetical protein